MGAHSYSFYNNMSALVKVLQGIRSNRNIYIYYYYIYIIHTHTHTHTHTRREREREKVLRNWLLPLLKAAKFIIPKSARLVSRLETQERANVAAGIQK